MIFYNILRPPTMAAFLLRNILIFIDFAGCIKIGVTVLKTVTDTIVCKYTLYIIVYDATLFLGLKNGNLASKGAR